MRTLAILTVVVLATSAVAQDISTVTTDSGRYLSVLGKPAGATSLPGDSGPTGIHDITSNGGNGERGFSLTDGELAPSNGFVTWGAGQPAGDHYQGLKFKRPATIASIEWHNFTYSDGGTFATTPTIEVYDRGTDSWNAVGTTWSTPYDSSFNNGIQQYGITLDTPVVADGVRVIGPAADSPGPHDFVSTSELIVNGAVEWGVDLSVDLTDLPNTTPVMNDFQFGEHEWLIDDDLTTLQTTVFAENNGNDSTDYAGVLFDASQDDVAGLGIVFKRFFDGGVFDSFAIETYDETSDTWTEVTGLDTATYFDDKTYLTDVADIGVEAGYLFTFDAVDGVDGIRIIGDGWGTAWDGFIGVSEIQVFPVPEPTAFALLAFGLLVTRRR